MAVTERVVMVLVLVWGTQMQYGCAVIHRVLEGSPVVLICDLPYDQTKNLVWLKSDFGGVLRRLAGSPPEKVQRFGPFAGRTDIGLSGQEGVSLTMNSTRREDATTGGAYYHCQQPPENRNTTRNELIVTYPPDPPTNLTLNRTSEGLTGSCMAGQSYSGSQSICMEYQQQGTSTWKNGPCDFAVREGSTLQFEVDDLAPTQNYNVCCIASDGYGEKTTCQNAVTDPLTSADLSDGAIAGISVAVAVVILIIVIIAIVLCCRKYKGNPEGNNCSSCCPCGKRGDGPQDGMEMEERVHVAGEGNHQVDAALTGVNDDAVNGHSKKKEGITVPIDCCNCFRTIHHHYHHHYARTNSSEGTTAPSPVQSQAPTRGRGRGVERSNSRQDRTDSPNRQEFGMWKDIFSILAVNRLAETDNRHHLAAELNLSQEVGYQIDHDFRATGPEKLDRMLWQWKRQSQQPSPDMLVVALHNIGFGALADRVKEYLQHNDGRRGREPEAPNTNQTQARVTVHVEERAVREEEEPVLL